MSDLKNLLIALVGGGVLYSIFFDNILLADIHQGKFPILLFATMSLVAYPWKIGKHVYSLFGGVNESGDVYSLLEIHAKGENVFSIFCISIFSEATKSAVSSILGLMFKAKAKTRIELFVGIPIWCKSGENTLTIFGVSIFNHSKQSLRVFFGIDLFSKSGKHVEFLFGIFIGTKSVMDIDCFIGIPAFVKAGNSVHTLIGIPIMVRAEKNALLGFGIPLGQFGKERSDISWKDTAINF